MNLGSNLDDKDKTNPKGTGDDGAPRVSSTLTDDVDKDISAVAKAKVQESDVAAAAAVLPKPHTVPVLDDGTILGDPDAIPGLIKKTPHQIVVVGHWGDRLNRLSFAEGVSRFLYPRVEAEDVLILQAANLAEPQAGALDAAAAGPLTVAGLVAAATKEDPQTTLIGKERGGAMSLGDPPLNKMEGTEVANLVMDQPAKEPSDMTVAGVSTAEPDSFLAGAGDVTEPANDNVDAMMASWVNRLRNAEKGPFPLSLKEVKELTGLAIGALKEDKLYLELVAPVSIAGEVHGRFTNLLSLIESWKSKTVRAKWMRDGTDTLKPRSMLNPRVSLFDRVAGQVPVPRELRGSWRLSTPRGVASAPHEGPVPRFVLSPSGPPRDPHQQRWRRRHVLLEPVQGRVPPRRRGRTSVDHVQRRLRLPAGPGGSSWGRR